MEIEGKLIRQWVTDTGRGAEIEIDDDLLQYEIRKDNRLQASARLAFNVTDVEDGT